MSKSPLPQSDNLKTSLDVDHTPKPRGRVLRWALVIAAVAHVVIFVVLFVLPNYRGNSDKTANNDGSNASQDGGSNDGSDGDTPKRPISPISNDPKWKAPVENLVEDAIKNHENLTEEEKQSELEDQINKLRRISTPENVNKITEHLAPLVNNQDRKTQPEEQPATSETDQPSFDHDTAQVHDVVKSEKSGKTIYIATLLDKDGRTMKTELTAAEGESLHNTFQLIKKSPMLEKIYRGVVMGTLDKLLKPKSPSANETNNSEADESQANTPEPGIRSPEAVDSEAVDSEAVDSEAVDSEAVDSDAVDSDAVDSDASEEAVTS